MDALHLAAEERALSGLKRLRSLSHDELRSVTAIEAIIRECGLVKDDCYGPDNQYVNPVMRGIWQLPWQLAEFLVFSQSKGIGSLIEIGTFTGHTFAFCCEYFKRFQTDFNATSVDVNDHGVSNELKKLLGTRCHFVSHIPKYERTWDLGFIDGDHSFSAVEKDFLSLRDRCRFVAFHDINDDRVYQTPDYGGGVPHLWRFITSQLPKERWKEFTYHPENKKVMGIGVLINNGL